MKAGFRGRVLVTGSSGFIGGWVARTLADRGYSIRAQYRRQVPPDHLMDLSTRGAEIERRDLTDRQAVRSCLQNVQAVIHCAALSRDWGSEEQFHIHNLEITKSLLEEARQAGCRVFLFLSSLSVHGFGNHYNSTEDGPYYAYHNDYQRKKRAAERFVLAGGSPELRVTVIRPGNVYGPGDTTTFYRLFDAQEKGIRGTLGGGKRLTSPVYVEDLVEAVILALENDACAGQIFNITSGEEVTWKQLLGYSAELLGVKPWLALPIPVAWVAAYLLSWIYRLLRLKAEPPLCPYRVAHLAWDFHFNIARAKQVLGYRPRVDWREGLRRTVAAYRSGQ